MSHQTQTEMDLLRTLLEGRICILRADLEAAMRARDARVGAILPEVYDQRDDAGLLQRGEVDAESERLAAADLVRCEAALRRMDEGTYGECVDCGEPIALSRLRVQPQAERCHDCQEFHERLAA